MGSLSAALGLSEMFIHSVFLIVTENVVSLKVILEANYSALLLHSQHFSSFSFLLLSLQFQVLQLFSCVHPTNDTPSVSYPHREKNVSLIIPLHLVL